MEYTTIGHNEKPAVKAGVGRQLGAAASAFPVITKASAPYSTVSNSCLSQTPDNPCSHDAWQGLLHERLF